MKTYEEMAESALKRIELERGRQKKRRRILASVLCLSMVAGGPAVLWLHPQPYEYTASDTAAVAANSSANSPEEIYLHNKTEEDQIIINHWTDSSESDNLADLSTNRVQDSYIALLCEDFVKMTGSELCEYYGTRIFPDVPEDLTEKEADAYGIFRRNQGSGEVYHDCNVLTYENSDETRRLTVTVYRETLPISDIPAEGAAWKESVIFGEKVILGERSDESLWAQMEHHGAGFIFTFAGLDEDEILSVIRSLLK